MKIFALLSLAFVACGAVPAMPGMGMQRTSMNHGKNKMGGMMPMSAGGMGISMTKIKRENTDDLLKLIPADIADGLPGDLLGKPTGSTGPKPVEMPVDKSTEKPETNPAAQPETTPPTETQPAPSLQSNLGANPLSDGKKDDKTKDASEKKGPHTRMTHEDSHLSPPEAQPTMSGEEVAQAEDMTPIPIPVSEVIKTLPQPISAHHPAHPHREKPVTEGGHKEDDDDDDEDDDDDCTDKAHLHQKKHKKKSHHKKVEQEKTKGDTESKVTPEELPHEDVSSSSTTPIPAETTTSLPTSTSTPPHPHMAEDHGDHHPEAQPTMESIPPSDPKAVRKERNVHHHQHHSHHQERHDHDHGHMDMGINGHGHGGKGHMMHRRSADGYGSTATRSSSEYSDSAPVVRSSSSGYGATAVRTVVRETSEYSAPATRTVSRSSGYSSGTRSRSPTRSSSYGRAVREEHGYGYSTPTLDEEIVEDYAPAPVAVAAPTVLKTVTTYEEEVPAVREVVSDEYSAPAVREVSEEYSAPAPVRRAPLKFAVRQRTVVTKSSNYEAPTRALKTSNYEEPAVAPVVVRTTTYEEQPTRVLQVKSLPVQRVSTGYSSPIRISADRYKRSADGSGMITTMGGSTVSHFPKQKPMPMMKQ